MDRRLIGYIVSSFGLGILASAIIYPLGYLESKAVFRTMTTIGNILIFLGVFILPTVKKKRS